ncbi:MAG: STAS domain-containing protein, partial [Sediminispirochaetaceae bacterium]
VKGDMDLYNAHELKDVVNRLIHKSVTRIVINLEKVDYIDSSGVGALIHIFTSIKRNGFKLRITNVHGSVAKVIKLTKLIGYFPIVDDVKTALQQLSS